jgi:hypothetical protein
MRKWLFVLSITVVLTVPVHGAAQAPSTSFALLAGPSSYDLSGVGTGFAAAAQFSWSPLQILVLQPSVTAFSYRSQVETRITYLFTELSYQVQPRSGRVRPFIGGGAGLAIGVAGIHETVAALHVTLGLRVRIQAYHGIQAELRQRVLDPWSRANTDMLFGLSKGL